MKFPNKSLTTIFVCLALTGCMSTKKDINEETLSLYEQNILKEDKRTNEILSKAALLSSKSLAVFVRTEQAAMQKELTAEQIRLARFENNYVHVNMEQVVEYAWYAAPEALMVALASNAGYELIYDNERPPITRAVSISSKPRMIENYFDIIEQQSINNGYIKDIIIDDKYGEKSIRVIYADF